MSIPSNIEELAHKVRTEIYGRDVREALATSIEATAEVAEWSRQVAQQIIDGEFDEAELLTEIERKLNELEQEYAPQLSTIKNEVEDARGSDQTLGDRLDKVDDNLQQTSAQLAQTEQEVENLQIDKVDKFELQNTNNNLASGLNAKVDKGGNEQVSWSMLDQTTKENITGGNTPVVGVNSVNTSNIVDGAVTSSKVTANGGFAMVLTSGGYVNFDFVNSIIVFPNVSYILHKKARYQITNDEDYFIEFPNDTGSYILLFDTNTKVFRILTANFVTLSNESEVLIATVRRGVVNSAWAVGAYEINGELFGLEPSQNIPYITSRWTGKKAVFLGDSITNGSPRVADVNNRIYNVIKNELGLSESINYGENGTSIVGDTGGNFGRDFVTRYVEMEDDADLIFVFGGTNDYALNTNTPFGLPEDRTPTSFYGGLHTLVNGLLEKYPTGTIIFMTPTHRINSNGSYDTAPNSNTNKKMSEYSRAIEEVCLFYGIPVIDGFSIGLSPINGQQVERLFYEKTAPITHPNDEGSQFLGKAIASRLRSL